MKASARMKASMTGAAVHRLLRYPGFECDDMLPASFVSGLWKLALLPVETHL